jgi:UDP-N-acetylglucosamine 3-dehydrogenase
MLKVGVIGLGAMGQNHVRSYLQMDCSLVGIADVDAARAKEIGEKYGVPYYTGFEELLPKVDAVSIAVPTTLHYRIAARFLEKGIHCLVEKPIAGCLEEAEEISNLATENNLRLAIGHIERFNPAVLQLKKIIDRGVLGDLLIISTRRVGPYVPRIRDVGIVIDSATHDIGVANYLVDAYPREVYSRTGSLIHQKEDYAIIVLDFGKTTASIEVNWFTPRKVRTLVATGSRGIAYLDYIDQSLIVNNSHGMEKVDVQKAEPLRLELQDFLDSINENRSPAVDGKQGIDILKLALAATGTVTPNRL